MLLDKAPELKTEKFEVSDEEIDLKSIISDNESSRRDSNISTNSTDTNNDSDNNLSDSSSETKEIINSADTNDVEDLSKCLKTLKVEEDSDDEDFSELENELKKAKDEDFQDRAPMGGKRPPRDYGRPYNPVNRSVNHQSGGSLLQPADPPQQPAVQEDLPNFLDENYDFLVGDNFPQNNLAEPQLPDLGYEVGDFLNNVADLDALLNNEILNIPESIDNFNILDISHHVPDQIFSSPSTSQSFTTRQSSPAHSFSSGYQSSALSPQSYFSADTEPVGSPDLPATLPGSSGSASSDEDNNTNERVTDEVRNLIDEQHFTEKKDEWVWASSQEVEDLKSKLMELLLDNAPFTNRSLVPVYAIIHSLIKRDRNTLIQLFTENPNIIVQIALKNHPLLLRYILETMQNLGIKIETVGVSPISILKRILNTNKDMKEILKILLELRNVNNEVIFSLSERDQYGLTFLHRVFLKMQEQKRDYYNAYLLICLSFNPDLTLLDSFKKTYLHYAVEANCNPYIIDQIISKANAQNGLINIVNAADQFGITALRLAANITEGRKEIEDVIRRYDPYEINNDFLYSYEQF